MQGMLTCMTALATLPFTVTTLHHAPTTFALMRCTLPQGWLRVARAVNADPVVANRAFYDVLNEPDAFGVRFEPSNGRPGMKDLYFLAFDAIYSVNPSAPLALMCITCY
jgi:hypothetical protein